MKLEVCVDSVESAVAAQEGGADGVELCANLDEEGTTPGGGLVETARREISIRLLVMVRPRAGEFIASDFDLEIMKRDIESFARMGVDGLVLGLLRPDFSVDIEKTGALVEMASPLPVTFHRAFDLVPDQENAVRELLSAGIGRILTSGGEPSALSGAPRIRRVVEVSDGRMIIAAAGGITEDNVAEVVDCSGAQEVHVGGAVSRIERFGFPPFQLSRRTVVRSMVSSMIRKIST